MYSMVTSLLEMRMGREESRRKKACIVIAIALLIASLIGLGAPQNPTEENQNIMTLMTANQGNFVNFWSEEAKTDQYFYNESEGESSTRSTSYVDKTTLQFTLSSAGNYTILASAELKGSSTTYDVKARFLVDETTYAEYVSESEEANIYHHYFIAHRTIELASGTHTLKIQSATESSSATAYIRRARIAAIKVTSFEYSETDTEQSLNTSYADKATLTFSVGTPGEYLIISSAESRAASTSNSVYGRTLVDGSSIGESLFEGQDVADYKPHFTANITNLSAGSHIIKVQGRSESGTMYMRRARISVIPITGNFDNDYISISEAETTNGATTPANKTVLTFTPPSQATYLILSLGILGGDARNGAAYNAYTDTQIDGAVIAEGQFGIQDNTDRHSILTIKNITLAASSHTINRRYWSGASASPDASLKNTRVIALTPITSPAVYVAWNQSTLNLGTEVQGGGNLAGSANITSTGNNTNVTVTCDSGNCSVITETWDDTADMSDGQSLSVTFTCDDSTIGSFWAKYNVTSVEDTTPDLINVSCTISASFVSWNQSTLNLSTGVQGGGDLNGSANITSTGNNTNVTVTCDSGNCSVITETWDDITDMSDGQSLGVMFTCDDNTAGSFWAKYNVTSVEDTTPDLINVSCTISEPTDVSQIHYRWRNDDGVEGNKTFSATTGDGYVQASNSAYSTAHDASTGTVNTSGNEIRVGQQLTGGTYYIDRSALFFDTSAIPDDATITNATLTLYVSGDYSDTNFDIQIQRPRLTLSEKATTTVTGVYQIHGQDYDGSQYIYWSSRNQAAESLTKMDKDAINSYTTYDPTGHDGVTFRDDYVLYCTANSKVYVVAQDANDLNHATLYEFNPSNSSYVQKIDFNDASIPGGLVYAFGYLWTGSRNGYVYRVNLSDFSYDTYDFGTDSDNLHWLGANSNYVWGTSVESDSSLLKIYPNGTKAGHWQVGYMITDDNYVDDSKVYMSIEAATTGIRVFDISSQTFTTYTSSGTSTGYGVFRWNFTDVYNETEDWLVACYGGSDHIIWYEKSTVAEIRRVNTYTDFTTQLDSPNEIQVIGDYLYVTSWTANPTRICKYRLDKPEITAPLEAADYNKDLYRKNGGSINTSRISGPGTIEISLNTMGIKWINKTGITTLNIRSSKDINSNTPMGDEYITFYSANKGAGYEPVLAVTYQNAATWMAAEDTNVTVQKKNENIRVRFSVQNTGENASNYNYLLQVAAKSAAACCEDVASGNFADVPTVTGGCSSAAACMNTSAYFDDQDPTSRQLSIPDSLPFTAGRMVEDPSNQTNAFTLNRNYFTEFEYNFYFTDNAASGTTYCFRLANAGVALDNYTKVAMVTLEAYGDS